MGIRPLSAVFDLRDEIALLVEEARDAGLEDDQIASILQPIASELWQAAEQTEGSQS